MNTQEIFDLGIKMGIKADPRGKTGVKRWLDLQKMKFEKLSNEDKNDFDTDLLTNPYSDSRVLFDNKKTVKRMAAGIDISAGEIAILNSLEPKVDLVMAHHPEGKALAALDEVMHLQADLMASYGVPINVAEGVMHDRIEKVSRQLSPENHRQAIDAAKLVNLPMFCLHTPCDNLVFQFLQNLMDTKKPETVGEIVDLLKTVPEYRQAMLDKAGPRIFAGSPDNRCGKIVAYDITGGTSGSKEIYPELVRAGIGTVIGMHMNEENREEALKNHLNIVIAGHISSDSLGMNLFLDEIEKQGIEIVPISGLIRVKRTK